MATHNLPELAKKIYGASDERVKQIQQMYMASQTQINDIISRFIADERNWSSKAPKAEIQQFMDQLRALAQSASDSDKTLMKTVYDNKPMKTNADLLTASVNLVMVQLAMSRKKQLTEAVQVIPQEVHTAHYQKAKDQIVTDLKHYIKQIPTGKTSVSMSVKNKVISSPAKRLESDKNGTDELRQRSIEQKAEKQLYGKGYHPKMTQKAISKIVTGNYYKGTNPYTSINEDTARIMLKLNKLAITALKNHQKPQDYSKEIGKLLTGQGISTNGAMSKAATIMRTQAAYIFGQSKLKEFKSHGATRYRNVSVESETTCDFCGNEMDGTEFNIEDAEPGVNMFPFHPNCQCDIEEVPDDDYESMMD